MPGVALVRCQHFSTCPSKPPGMESPTLPRTMLQVPLLAQMQQQQQHVDHHMTILQWNVLADGLAQHGEFTRVDEQHLQWEHRAPLILRELALANADIICLQEVNHFDDWLQPELAKHGYVGSFWPKAHSPCRDYGYPPDGCALFYREEAFQPLLDTPKGFVFPAATPQAQPGSQGVLLVHLRQRESGRVLVVACTHLKAKAGEANELLREFQAQQLCRFVELETAALRHAGNGASAVVVCGDFNTTLNQSACVTMRNAGFISTWEAAGRAVPDGVFSTWKFRPAGEKRSLIDFVWLAGQPGEHKLALTDLWSMPEEEDIGEHGLPCGRYPSDHLAVLARVGWSDLGNA